MLRARFTILGTLALLACGTDTFVGDGGVDSAVDDSPADVTAMEASADVVVPDVGESTDASSDVVVVLTDGACTDMCVACVQKNCGLQVLTCDLNTVCKGELASFVTCRCAGEGGACDGVFSSSNNAAQGVVSCGYKNCPACGF